ncbi:MAG: tRNA-guanine transglycosylase [Candidatus Helarchaeota archaeon]
MNNFLFSIKKINGFGRTGLLRNWKNHKIKTPLSWFGLSVIESIDFQKNAFRESKIEAFLGNAYDYIFQDKKHRRLELSKQLVKDGLLFKCDSGGFQKSKKDIDLKVEKVYELQKELKCDIAVQLDFPFNPNNLRDSKRRLNISINNFKELYNLNNDEITIMPVIHGYNEKMLDYAIDQISKIIDDTPKIIGIGSLVPLLRACKGTSKIGGKSKMIDIILHVREKLPDTFLHIFGVGGTMAYLAVFCGADSFDFTGWIVKAGHGVIQLPGISDRYVDPRERRKSLNKEEWKLFMDCECPICKNYDINEKNKKQIDFQTYKKPSIYRRAVHNLWVFQNEIYKMRNAIENQNLTHFIFERLKNSIWKRLLEETFFKLVRMDKINLNSIKNLDGFKIKRIDTFL